VDSKYLAPKGYSAVSKGYKYSTPKDYSIIITGSDGKSEYIGSFEQHSYKEDPRKHKNPRYHSVDMTFLEVNERKSTTQGSSMVDSQQPSHIQTSYVGTRFERKEQDQPQKDKSLTFSAVVGKVKQCGIKADSVGYIYANFGYYCYDPLDTASTKQIKEFNEHVNTLIKSSSKGSGVSCIIVGPVPAAQFQEALKKELATSSSSSDPVGSVASPLLYKRQLNPVWCGFPKNGLVRGQLGKFFEQTFIYTNLAEELEIYQAAFELTGVKYYNKIYDLSNIARAKNAEEAKKMLRERIKDNQSIYYLSQNCKYGEKSLTQLIAEIKGSPCLVLVANEQPFAFSTLRKEWEANYTFVEKWIRFFKALNKRTSFISGWFKPSNILILVFLLVSVNLLLYHFWPLIFAQAAHGLMIAAFASLVISVPFLFLAIYEDYHACKDSQKNLIFTGETGLSSLKNEESYSLLAYMADVKSRLSRWLVARPVQLGLLFISSFVFLLTLFCTIGFFTNGFGLAPHLFSFMEPVFTFLHTVLAAAFSFTFLTPETGMLLATITAGVLFVVTPLVLIILGGRFFAVVETLDESVDVAIDPYYEDEPKGRKDWFDAPLNAPQNVPSLKNNLRKVDNKIKKTDNPSDVGTDITDYGSDDSEDDSENEDKSTSSSSSCS
jgi:hypothetical protein